MVTRRRISSWLFWTECCSWCGCYAYKLMKMWTSFKLSGRCIYFYFFLRVSSVHSLSPHYNRFPKIITILDSLFGWLACEPSHLLWSVIAQWNVLQMWRIKKYIECAASNEIAKKFAFPMKLAPLTIDNLRKTATKKKLINY